VLSRFVSHLPHCIDNLSGCLGQKELNRAPVRGITLPFDPSRILKPVDDTRERYGCDREILGDGHLADPLVLGQIREYLPLRLRQTEWRRTPIQLLAHEAGDVVQKEADALDFLGSLRQCARPAKKTSVSLTY